MSLYGKNIFLLPARTGCKTTFPIPILLSFNLTTIFFVGCDTPVNAP